MFSFPQERKHHFTRKIQTNKQTNSSRPRTEQWKQANKQINRSVSPLQYSWCSPKCVWCGLVPPAPRIYIYKCPSYQGHESAPPPHLLDHAHDTYGEDISRAWYFSFPLWLISTNSEKCFCTRLSTIIHIAIENGVLILLLKLLSYPSL